MKPQFDSQIFGSCLQENWLFSKNVLHCSRTIRRKPSSKEDFENFGQLTPTSNNTMVSFLRKRLYFYQTVATPILTFRDTAKLSGTLNYTSKNNTVYPVTHTLVNLAR